MSGARLERFTDIRDADLRGRDGLFCVESPRIVARFLHALIARAGGAACTPALGVEAVLLTREHASQMDALLGLARECLPPFEVTVASPEEISGTTGYSLHRGAVALGRRASRGRVCEGSLESLAATGIRTIIACDRVVHVDNIGALFRNAGSFGDAGVLLGPGCGDALSRKAVRISSGRVFTVPWAEAASLGEAIAELRARHGFGVIACEDAPAAVTPERAIADLRARGSGRAAFVMGSEGTGLGPALLAQCDAVACIPMRLPRAGRGNPVPLEESDRPSLNVSVASAIVLHEARRADAHPGAAAR